MGQMRILDQDLNKNPLIRMGQMRILDQDLNKNPLIRMGQMRILDQDPNKNQGGSATLPETMIDLKFEPLFTKEPEPLFKTVQGQKASRN